MKVRHDTIFVIRVALILAGVVPGDWKESWKTKLFKMYAVFLDVQFVTFVLAKFMYTFQDSKYNKELLSFFEGWFESIILLCLTLQRIAFRWKENQLLELLKQLEILKPKITTPTLNSYDNLACKISLSFGSLVMMAHFQLVVNYALNYCEKSGFLASDLTCRKLLVEIWVPFDHLSSWGHSILFSYNFFQTVPCTFMLYISLVIIPIFITKISCQLKAIADAFENELSTQRILSCSQEQLTEEIVVLIKHHQMILGVARLMNTTFHIVLLFKLVFMSLPMVIVALTLSQLPFGSFQFLRFILLIAVPLSELFTFCYFGEQLQYHSLMIHRAVYMNNWYRMSKGNQKLLLVVAIRAIRPVRLDVWPHFIPASLDTFLNLCQLSYSAYSVLAGTTTRKIN
ncbi:odorant binding [Homalodisca vitripennis]|nr:odorant binding [Homalodisca vitripennis]